MKSVSASDILPNKLPVSIPPVSEYTGFFLFSCRPSFAAKSDVPSVSRGKTPAIQAPHLWLSRPPVQKPLLCDFGGCVYHIKKEFDEEGADENGVGGIDNYYFGRRAYDPSVGRWTSADPLRQFHDSYLYCAANPVNQIDDDGQWSVFTHFFTGFSPTELFGGWNAAAPDAWNNQSGVGRWLFPESGAKRKAGTDSHTYYQSMKETYNYLQGPKPEGLSDRQWRGVRTHMIADYFNQGQGSSPMSATEAAVDGIWGKGAREGFQDVKEVQLLAGVGLLFTPLAPLGLLFLADYAAGLLNLHAAMHGLDYMIRNDLYIKGMDEGGRGRLDIQMSEYQAVQPRVTLRSRSTGKKARSIDLSGKGASDGGGTVICTELFRRGLMSRSIYVADEEYGRRLRRSDPLVYWGYRAWADPIVRAMQKDGVVGKALLWFIRPIALAWAKEMAFQIAGEGNGSVLGRRVMLVGYPLCRLIGRYTSCARMCHNGRYELTTGTLQTEATQ